MPTKPMEFGSFMDGYVLKLDPSNMKPTQLQVASNIDLATEVGEVAVRRGTEKYLANSYQDTPISIYWQDLFTTSSLFSKAGYEFRNGTNPVGGSASSSSRTRFCEFNDLLLAVGGTSGDRLKYREEGIQQTWNRMITQWWETEFLTARFDSWSGSRRRAVATVNPLSWNSTKNCFCTVNWESYASPSGTVIGYPMVSGQFERDYLDIYDERIEVLTSFAQFGVPAPDAEEFFRDFGAYTRTWESTYIDDLSTGFGSTYDVSYGCYFWDQINYPNGYSCTFLWEHEYFNEDGSMAGGSTAFYTDYVTDPEGVYAEFTAGGTGVYYYFLFENEDGTISYISDNATQFFFVDLANADVTIPLHNVPISKRSSVIRRHIYKKRPADDEPKLVITLEDNYTRDFLDDTGAGAGAELDYDLLSPAPPYMDSLHAHNSILWGISSLHKNRVYYIDSTDAPETWSATGYEVFGSEADITKGLATIGRFLVVVQEKGIWKRNTSELSEISTGVFAYIDELTLSEYGAAAIEAVLTKGELLYFGCSSGIYGFDTVRDIKLSTYIDPIFDVGGDYSERLNVDYRTNMAIGHLKERIFISYTRTGQTTNDRTLIYNRELKCVETVMTKGFDAFSFDELGGILYASSPDGYVYKVLSGSDDNGTAIAWSFRTADLGQTLGRLIRKQGDMVKIDCDVGSGSITVGIYIDATLVDTKTISASGITRWRLPVNYEWYKIWFDVSGSGSGQAVRALGFEAEPLAF